MRREREKGKRDKNEREREMMVGGKRSKEEEEFCESNLGC